LAENQKKIKNMKKFIAFGDVHGENKYLKIVLDFSKKIKPDYIIISGDLLDFQAISKYDLHKRNVIGINECIRETQKEIKWANSVLDDIDKTFPKSKKVFIQGNHDVRYNKFYTYDYPQKENNKIKDALKLDNRGWEYIDIGGYFKLGKLYFMHGEKFQGDLFAKQAAIKLRKNVRLWHNHTNQSYTITSPLDSKDIIECKSVGCLCGKDPVYLKGMTNRWINSFLFGYIDEKSGLFQDFTINIIKNKIICDIDIK